MKGIYQLLVSYCVSGTMWRHFLHNKAVKEACLVPHLKAGEVEAQRDVLIDSYRLHAIKVMCGLWSRATEISIMSVSLGKELNLV